MDLEKLKAQFLIDGEIGADRLARLIERLLPHCVVRKDGTVDIFAERLSGKEQIKLVLVARFVASKIGGSTVAAELSADEISRFIGLPKNQAAARAKELVDEGFAERSARGSYRARHHKLDGFAKELASLAESKENK
jgi:Fic family protein